MRTLAVFFISSLLFVSSAFAEVQPAEVVTEMIAKIKAEKNPAVIANYVHWPTAFKALDPKQKRLLEVNTADELKTYYKNLLNDPRTIILSQLEKHIQDLPEDKQAAIKARLSGIADQASSEFQKKKNKFLDSDYTVGESKISGDAASVEIFTNSQGEKKSESLSLIKVDNRWYLPSVDKLGKDSNGPGSKDQSSQ